MLAVLKLLFETTSRRISGLINRFQNSECVRDIFFNGCNEAFSLLQLKFHTIILKCAPGRSSVIFSLVGCVGVVHFFSYQREPELRTCSVNDFPGPAVRQSFLQSKEGRTDATCIMFLKQLYHSDYFSMHQIFIQLKFGFYYLFVIISSKCYCLTEQLYTVPYFHPQILFLFL